MSILQFVDTDIEKSVNASRGEAPKPMVSQLPYVSSILLRSRLEASVMSLVSMKEIRKMSRNTNTKAEP